MSLTRYAIILTLHVFSAGIATAQEHSPTLPDPTNELNIATLAQRAELFDAKAKLATQCAKGLRLAQSVMSLTSPDEDIEDADWTRETYLFVQMWFSKEQQDEWYFAGKEFGSDFDTFLKGVPTKEEALDRYKKMFAQMMNAQVAALEKLSDDLDARIYRIQEPRSSE